VSPRHRRTTPHRRIFLTLVGVAVISLGVFSLPAQGADPAPQVIKTAYVTGYSYWDNTPPGSSAIAFPKSSGNPTLHNKAAGTGTYADPITLAVGWTKEGLAGTDWPVGSRFYLPFLHKYVMVEDQCGDRPARGPCHELGQADPGSTTWLDVWVDGQAQSRSVSDACMSKISVKHTVVFRPGATYPVNPGTVTAACQAKAFFSETPPTTPTSTPTPTPTTTPTPTPTVNPTLTPTPTKDPTTTPPSCQ
jgi:hypothetical protein